MDTRWHFCGHGLLDYSDATKQQGGTQASRELRPKVRLKRTVPTLNLVSNVKIIVACVLVIPSAQGQTDLVNLFIDAPRPIAEVARTLASKYSVAITYEDPRLEYPGDIQGRTRTRRHLDRVAPDEVHRVLFPANEVFNATYYVSAVTGKPEDWAATLRQLIGDYEIGGRGGRFRITRTEDVFHIIPTHARNSNGQWVENTSILGTPISVRALEGEGLELVAPVAEAITKATGFSVGIGNMPADLFFRHRGRTGVVDEEPAREVLLRVLHSIDDRLTWRLYHGPGTMDYTLNIFLVGGPQVAPPQPTTRRPLPDLSGRTPGQGR